MKSTARTIYNHIYGEAVFTAYERYLVSRVGGFGFRLAETPLFMSPSLVNRLTTDARAICAELANPDLLPLLKKAIPPELDAPNMTALPECVQVDFALVQNENGELEGKVVELQGFPSLYALEVLMADAWRDVLSSHRGVDREWSCLFDLDRESGLARIGRLLTADVDPAHVAMIDFEPEAQKTWPDFAATRLLFGIEPVSVSSLIKHQNRLFREEHGKLVPIERIYNRLVFDELAVKNVKLPFSWRDELDVTWCAHPNWYWAWSKYSLPYLKHAAVPDTRFLCDVKDLPEDLSAYVLKPLFSYAGSGVIVDVTREAIERIPHDKRHAFILQKKVTYADAIRMPDGTGVKAEVRIMLLADGGAHVPILPLVRLSRGKMLGVDQNKSHTWVGGTVGIFDPAEK